MTRIALACILLLALFGCTKAQFGLPRTQFAATSPDGRFTAYVRNHPTIDPPDQSLWLKRSDGNSIALRKLGADSQWCKQIVWSADSSTVAFLIGETTDVSLMVVDAGSGKVTHVRELWSGPVANLSLSSDGTEASYRRCAQADESGPRDCQSPITVRLKGN